MTRVSPIRRLTLSLSAGLLTSVLVSGAVSAESMNMVGDKSAFETIVDAEGQIALPEDDFLRDWTLLGTWTVNGAEGEGAEGFHSTYTTSDVVDEFRETGKWKDGAILIKELRHARTDDYTTGKVSSVADLIGWFVMVKDTENRFPENRLWGEGWGWGFFKADAPEALVTKDYESECLGCHVPVQQTDWVYDHAYPVLRKE